MAASLSAANKNKQGKKLDFGALDAEAVPANAELDELERQEKTRRERMEVAKQVLLARPCVDVYAGIYRLRQEEEDAHIHACICSLSVLSRTSRINNARLLPKPNYYSVFQLQHIHAYLHTRTGKGRPGRSRRSILPQGGQFPSEY
jgi:hypothetical protein